MEKLAVKISKLAYEAGGPAEAGNAFIAAPEHQLEERLGTIFSLVELSGLPDQAAEKIFEVIYDLETEYYLPPLEIADGLEKRFEECLQRANRRVYKIIQESVVKLDMKGVNVLIGLAQHNRLFMSQIGRVNAFLFHRRKKYDSKIIDILNQTGEKKQKVDPEKAFSNIISGAITENDSVVFANEAILDYFSQNQIMEIISENKALAAIREMERVLDAQGAVSNCYAVILQPDAPVISDEPPIKKSASSVMQHYDNRGAIGQNIAPEHSIKRLLTTQDRTEKYLTPSLMPNWQKFLLLSWQMILKGARLGGKYSALAARNIWDTISEYSVIGINKIRRQMGARIKPPAAMVHQQPAKQIITEKKPNIERPKLGDIRLDFSWSNLPKTISQGLIAGAKYLISPRTWHNVWRAIISGNKMERLSDWLNHLLARLAKLSRGQKIILAVALMLVFGFSQSIIWQGQQAVKGSVSGADDLVKQIQAKLNSAEAQNIFNDEAGAKSSLEEAKNLLTQLPNKLALKKTHEDLQAKIDSLTQALQKVVYLDNPTVVADLANKNASANAVGLSATTGALWTYDSAAGKIYKIDLAKQQVLDYTLATPLPDAKKIIALDDKTLLMLIGDKKIYRYTLGATSTALVLTAKDPVIDIAAYGGKLYTLVPSKNQVYKHFASEGGFNAGSAWFKDVGNLSDARALTLDGGLLLARAGGSISVYNAGVAKDIKFSVLSPTVDPIQIIANTDSTFIYLLDNTNKRLVVYDKNGNLKTQITSKAFGQLKAFALVEKEKKLYLLSDNKVYLVNLGF